LTNEAVANFIEQEEYDLSNILEIVDASPSLRLSRNLIEEELVNCPGPVCKDILQIIKNKEVFLFEEKFETVHKKLASLNKENLAGVFLHMAMDVFDVNKTNEIIKGAAELLKKDKMLLKAGVRVGSKVNKILLFVAYNAKEETKK